MSEQTNNREHDIWISSVQLSTLATPVVVLRAVACLRRALVYSSTVNGIPKFIGHLNTIKCNNDAPKLGAYDYENRKYVELMLEIDFVLHLLFLYYRMRQWFTTT